VIQSRNTKRLNAKNTSGYRGVSKYGRRYIAYISIYKRKHLGTFDTPEQAAFAYDAYVLANKLEHTTNFKITNIIGDY
jgi:hypothetical protein